MMDVHPGKVTVAAVQMSCNADMDTNLVAAEDNIRKATSSGAQVILLPELFARPYFCQERRYEYYDFAKSLLKDAAVLMGVRLATELNVVLPISFYERDGNVLYNTVACIDAGGEILGIYRKTHIPDDHCYQEKFYFTPGDTGFQVFNTRFGALGIGICWDQWFPEAARIMALEGAEMLLYPTAIGSEPILEVDSMLHWRRCMQGHAACNLVPVITANRVGTEDVAPCKENGGQKSSLRFYGSSFLTDETGEIIESADDTEESILFHEYDLDQISHRRLEWGLFRDRRPECYRGLSQS